VTLAGSACSGSTSAEPTSTGFSADNRIAAEQSAEIRALPSDLTLPPGQAPTTMPDRSAVRFLAQASFGARPGDVEALRPLWRNGWIDQQAVAPLGRSHWDRTLARYEDWLAEDPTRVRGPNSGGAQVFEYALWEAYLTAPDALRKRIGFALSQIFVTSLNGFSGGAEAIRMLGAGYLDLLERHAFGNYRALLEDVTLSPAMGMYLSHRNNRKATYDSNGVALRVPDENYAREVMQLFTIGLVELTPDGTAVIRDGAPVATYTQDDVTQLARVFTGWRWNTTVPVPERYRASMVMNAADHAPEEKRFLGTVIPAGTSGQESLRIALDTLFAHPNVGPFIGRQLIQRLVTSNPSPAYVGRVAAAFNDNGRGVRGDLLATVRAVLVDPDALSPVSIDSPAADWGKLREPVVRYTQVARMLNAQLAPGQTTWRIADMSNPGTRLGQSPMRSPSVFNFYRPGYVPPNTPIATAGLVAPEFQITNDTSVPGYVNTIIGLMDRPPDGVILDYTPFMAVAADPAALVARVNLLLAHGSLGPISRDVMLTALAALPAASESELATRVRTAIALAAASPDYIVQR
jgi:uncharacterized protein (DUF1800 family)